MGCKASISPFLRNLVEVSLFNVGTIHSKSRLVSTNLQRHGTDMNSGDEQTDGPNHNSTQGYCLFLTENTETVS